MRCLLEIARGYLDLAEADGDQKEWGLHRAENWLNRFGNDTMSAKWPSLRRHFLHARLRLLKGDIEGAEGILFEASRPVDGDDAPVLGVSYNLNGVMILLQSVPPRLEKAQMMLDKCLAALRERRVNHAVRDVRHDPIYEARCYLLLAKTKLLSRDIRGAQKCLDDWKVLSQFVEKYFLHHLGESLQKEIYRKGPIFVRPFDLCDVSTKRVVKKIPDLCETMNNG